MLKSEREPPFPGRSVFQCLRCAETTEKKPKVCTECGCRLFREVDTSWGTEQSALDRPDPESTKHFRKKITECLNYSTSAKNPFMKWSHPLQLRRVVSREGNQYVKVEMRCVTCSLVYNIHCIPLSRADVLKRELSKDELKQLKIELPEG